MCVANNASRRKILTRRRKKKKRRTKIFSSFPKEHRMTQLTHASTKSASRTGSSASLEFRNGRLVAITHHVPKTGYKSIHSHGHEKTAIYCRNDVTNCTKGVLRRALWFEEKAARKIPPLGRAVSSQTVHRERRRTSFRVHLHFRNLQRFLPNISWR